MSESNNARNVHILGLEKSNFVRSVMLVCAYKKIEYTVGFDFDGQTIGFKSQAHHQYHPFAKIPVLFHQELVLPETASICRYLEQQFPVPSMQSDGHAQRALEDAWSAMISIDIDHALMRQYVIEFAFPQGEEGAIRYDVAKQKQSGVHQALKVIESALEAGLPCLNGEQFSIADALLLPMLFYVSHLPDGFNLTAQYEQINRYLARYLAQPFAAEILLTPSFAV